MPDMDDPIEVEHDWQARHCVCCGAAHLARAPAVLMPFVADRALGWAPQIIDASWGLQTIPEGRAYTLCNTLRCAACGLLFLDLRFSDRQMRDLYAGYRGAAYTALREHYEPGYAARNAGLEAGVAHLPAVEDWLRPRLPAHPVVLDWGGDTGRNTPFRNVARRLDIFDITDKPLVAGARRVDAAGMSTGGYDLVVCAQVLEHLPWPLQAVRAMRAALGPDTLLYVEVPYEQVMRASGDPLPKKHHWHEHINFFTPGALARLLERAGLEVLDQAPLQIATGAHETWLLRALARRADPRAT